MIKVLFVASANRNGISPIVKAQGESLSRQGLLVDYYGIKGRGFIGYFRNIPRLAKYIKASNADIVHAHYSLSGIVAGFASRSKPLVMSLMGSDTKAGFLQTKLIQLFALNRLKITIVKSVSMKKDIGLSDAVVIPNGVNLDAFKPMSRAGLKEKYSFSSEKKTILYLANPNRPEKNFLLAESALKLFNPSEIELKVLYGIPHSEVPEIINAADIVLLTSKWEGSPNIIKEAMACNCPVVATDVGDIRWLFGSEPGHYITGLDTTDVFTKLKLALEFAKEFGRTNGRNRIIALGLSSKLSAQRIIELYEGLLKSVKK
jgi:teichuronic acid biosynthesis glycosyltransferase TuaC